MESDNTDVPDLTEEDLPPEARRGFEELGLPERVLARVRAVGYEQPTSIQSLFVPEALKGRDVMGQARTGTGKTAAFLLPVLSRLKPGGSKPKALILAPTRELALQIRGELGRLSDGLGFSSTTLYGGSGYNAQNNALARGVDLAVGTPGRVMDHMRGRRLDLSEIQMTVLDEADRMLDLGFRRDIEYILRHCPRERQTLLLSATIPETILKLARRFMRDPAELWLAPDKPAVEQIEQHYCFIEKDQKVPLLLKVLDEERPTLAIVFCATKLGARKLAAKLQQLKLNAREIHGDLIQSKREKIMGHFRKGRVRLLVATDVASRGLDVENISHIINYDVPFRAEDYVHRIGRTARMDREGKAFTFVTREEADLLTEIEQYVNKELHPRKYEDLTSLFWPTPPETLPPGFIGDSEETVVAEQDYVAAKPKGGRRERRGRPRKGTQRPRRSSDGQTDGAAGATQAGESGKTGQKRRGGGRRGTPVTATCSACGSSCKVNFKPRPGRPVYCDACFAALKDPTQGK